jgi:N utilization substance protein A
VAVHSIDPDVDPVGACVGLKGSRVQAIIRELKNEKIDIVRYDEDITKFIANALNPAKALQVTITDLEQRRVEVIVDDEQLSIAIGKRGQNVRLAAKLTGWNIDVRSNADKQQELESSPINEATGSLDDTSVEELAVLLTDDLKD